MNLPNGHFLQNKKYQLSHVVGQGGFGITYGGVWFTEVKGPLGTVKTEVPICIKEYFFKDYCYRDAETNAVNVHSETGKNLFNKFKEKLIKEAKILSEVHHPHIVNVLEVFEENNTAYIAMEFISGCSLKYMLEKDGVLPENKVLKYIHQIGKALQFVHEKNILHLDIKPSNIIIGKDDKARLIDFGVSKRYDVEDHETSTTMLTLSKGFASVEQYDDEGTQSFSPCPDIYSLGATMYNLLTGKIPTESILRATRPFVKPTEINPNISLNTEAVILKAMQVIPADRFQSVSELLNALDPIPEEKGVVSNTYIENRAPNLNDEETTILNVHNSPLETRSHSGDTTVISEISDPIIVKKKKKSPIIPIVVCSVALVGSAFVYWVDSKSDKPASTSDSTRVNLNEDLLSSNDLIKESVAQVSPNPTTNEKVETLVDITPAKEENKKIEQNIPDPKTTEPKKEEKKEKKDSSNSIIIDQPSKDEINVKYNELIASGKKKMESANFIAARKDFEDAKSWNRTDEVIILLEKLREKELEKEIIDRKAQYEEKISFGKYKIVRKKSTGKYGAIDVNGEEKIPCTYEQIGNPGNGLRSFQRGNGLWDIYNNIGVLVNSGLTDY